MSHDIMHLGNDGAGAYQLAALTMDGFSLANPPARIVE
jgi:hypothetical protein